MIWKSFKGFDLGQGSLNHRNFGSVSSLPVLAISFPLINKVNPNGKIQNFFEIFQESFVFFGVR
jgi:hypothetical protein